MGEGPGAELRRPGRIPEPPPAGRIEVAGGFDTDGDGLADTVVTDDGVDLVLLTDLDRDGLADQILRIGPDGITREPALGLPAVDVPGDTCPDAPSDSAETGTDAGWGG
jgi:hypothetical protein